MTDAIRPDHYKLTLQRTVSRGFERIDETKHVECIDVIEELGLDFSLGNALKYAWRLGRKHSNLLEDIKKCEWYLERWLRVSGQPQGPHTGASLVALFVRRIIPEHECVNTFFQHHAMLHGNLKQLCTVARAAVEAGEHFDPMPMMRELLTLHDIETPLMDRL